MSTQDSINLFNTFHQYTNVLADQTQLIKNRLIAAQDISEGFENIIASPHYSAFLEYGIPKFIQTLRDGEPQFVSETTEQEFRKLLLEIIHRIPTNEQLKPFVKPILTLMFELLEIENEENVLVALRVIIELHKQYRPQMQPEIQTFLSFVKGMYKELPNNAKVHFVVVSVGPDGLLPAENLDSVQGVIGNVNSGGKVPESPSASDVGGKSQSNCIPKATSSLKVLSELPIIVVLMYQLYKQNVHGVISDFIALVMNTITLQPTMAARKLPNFNKEVYVDFTAAQIKTLSILAYFVKIFQELVAQASQNLVGGMLGLFRYCPQEVAHLRKELLIAAKHILGTELRAKFVPHIEQLFDEEVLIGSGWTVNEGLRPLAYSTLADFVHHVRSLLSLPNLALAVHLFSKNVHDESLLISIQRMSCKLLLNLVDCIRQKSDEQGVGREILMKMLEVFVRKFKTTAKHHIPAILEKCQPSDSVTVASTKTDEKPSSLLLESTKEKTVSWRGSGSKDNLSVADYREMVKTLVCGVKTITWGAGSCKLTTGDVQIPVYPQGNKVFLPSETKIFIRLLKYALEALDVYQISVNPTGNGFIKMANSPQQIRMKEEKEILEHFAGVFTMLNTATFKEVFTATIEYLVDRIHSNYALQIIPNSFLANPHTSATFATILVRFLLNKLENMGTKSEKSNLYLKLFKLVFGSVSLFAQENEQMLKPHLHEIVNRSMELAMSAKEPYNYFLLLRALFRSIGGGSHDLLYQEFLPLLPNLLQGLNNLQSGIHKQYMKDLFVELCLTVPVRLSSLLPYLPMLMDPLVSALNGTQTLVSQGLRTLELCVDNLQPDFLYDHIQPVRADLMQALWRTLRNTVETIAHVAFRVLGKFGGASRRMLKEPQKLTYQQSENIGPCLLLSFLDTEDDVPLPVASVIERAGNVLKTPKPNVSNVNQQNNVAYDNLPFYRQQAWFIVKYFIVAAMSLEDNTAFLEKLAQDEGFKTKDLPVTGKPCVAPCADEQSKKTFQQALSGMLFAAATTELQDDSLPFMAGVLRHFALVTVVQQAGSFAYITQTSITGMDVHIIIDSIADIMSHEDKDLCKTGELAIQIIFETIAIVLQDKLKASQLPFFEYMIEKLCGCCYERAWFAKAGGCMAVKFLLDFMPLQWLLEHQPTFITALMFVMMDLTNEVSSGTVEAAKTILIDLLKKCNCDLKDEDLTKVQTRVFPHVVQHMVREVVSPNHTVRAQARNALDVLSQLTGKSVHSLMEPHKALLEDMIPPKKHLLRHQPANTQIALMDGNTFCTSLSPRLFTMDLTIIEHKVFFTELYTLCEADDSQLTKLPCYKNVPSFAQLRISALAALTSCHYIVQAREKIFNVLVKAINSSVPEVMEAGKENMRKFINGGALDSVKDHVRVNIRPLLLLLGDFRSLNMSVLQKLTCFMELFPDLFNEKLCEQLLAHLTRWTEAAKAAANTQTQQQIKPALRSSEEVKICAAIMNMFQLVPAASSKLIEPLVQLTVKIERALILEVGSPFREPLIKFLMRYPSHTADFFLMNIANPLMNRFFIYMLNREDAKPLRVAVEANPLKLVNSTFSANIAQPQTADEQSTVSKKRQELQFQGILIIRTLVEHNGGWLAQQPVLIGHLRRIGMNEASFEKGKKNETSISSRRWREPKLLAKCLLNYVKHRPNEVELLFQILRIFTIRTIPDFHFLSKFLDDITKEYKIEQKRNVFFKFADCFLDHNYAQELKAMILQHIIIPLFKTSFEGGQVDQLIGGPPNPDHDSNDNVISVFINKVIDPQSPFATSDSVRILLLQFSALLVEYAAPHIHDAANKKQGNKLRRLFQYAWPCLLPKQCVDPATKYHGHYLHAQIISKFAIHKKFVLQVFHGLLKAHAQEARTIVRQALDILTPVMPHRMEDGNQMLSHWTKKIIVEEGHTIGQLVHMLHLVVRHHEVYYPVRKDLVPHMVNSMQRLGFNSNATIDQRKLAVDLAEIVTEWEKRNSKEQIAEMAEIGTKRSISDSTSEPYPKRICTPGQNTRQATAAERALKNTYPFRIEKTHTDSVCNFLFRIASQVNDASSTGSSPGEALSRRCFKILKNALQPDCWPNTDLRVTWLDKLFNMMDQTPNANYGNVCTALEILAYLCTVLPKDDLLAIFKPLQRGIVSCMACQNMKVVKSVNGLLLRLLTVFPIDQGTGQPKQDDLDYLYNNIGSSIYEGLLSYERSANSATNIIYGPLMLLKAACGSSPTYIDKFMVQFMKALNRMQKDHVAGQQGESGGLTEMLILSLELVKNRMGAMHGDLRRIFLSTFTTLIEKSPEAKLLKSMTKIVDEWMKIKPIQNSQHHCPSIREKSVILYRMMLNFEKRFSDDLELHAQFLEIVNHIYRDPSLMGSELTARLEPAFLAGLRSVQPHIRIKFMEVFDRGIKKRLYDRLMFIIATQNWEHMGNHFWIKQCLEIMFAVANQENQVKCSSIYSKLPSVKSILRQSSLAEAQAILQAGEQTSESEGDTTREQAVSSRGMNSIAVKQEPVDPDEPMETDDDGKEKKETVAPEFYFKAKTAAEILAKFAEGTNEKEKELKEASTNELASNHGAFLEELRRQSTGPCLSAIAQLCHRSTLLAHKIWVDLFPRIWDLLEEKYQGVIAGELGPFLCSGSHLHQSDCFKSSVNTLVEGMSNCTPPIPVRPIVLKYLGKTHNLWHRSALLLEEASVACEDMISVNPQLPIQQPWLDYGLYDEEVSELPVQETFDSLAEIYSMLSEDDMWSGLMHRKARFPETYTAIAYEQQGLFEQAQKAFETAMAKAREQYNNGKSDPRMLSEYALWEQHWIRAAKELGQWDILMEFGKSKGQQNPMIVLESAWRIPDWTAMKEALTQVEMSSPDSMAYRLTLYRGFIAICHPDEQHQHQPALIEKLVETATAQAIRQWRRLPAIVTDIHAPLLRTAQQIMELQEASQVHVGLQPQNIGRVTNLHDMKAIVKTWRNRLPLQCDDLVHWSDVFMWRHHHYQAIVAAYENLSSTMPDTQSSNHAMLGVHASAWSIIHYGHVARKHDLTGVCLDSLSRIHTIPSVPIVDCFHKIREQVKCYLQMAGVMGKQELQEGLEVIESTNLRYFSKEMTAEFFALKGMFLAQVNRSEEANKAFSEAVQMHDTLVKAWALWGDYLDNLFVNERNITTGAFAIICYMHACRSQNESKCRKYLARTLWLLSYDDEKGSLAESLEKYCVGVPSAHWLPWIPQLLTCFVRKEGSRVLNLIFSVARVFPQAVYFPIRTLYLTLKIEQREKHRMERRQSLNGENKPGINASEHEKKGEQSCSTSTVVSTPSTLTTVTSKTDTTSSSQDAAGSSSTATPTAATTSATISLSEATPNVTTPSSQSIASTNANTTTPASGGSANSSQNAGSSEAGMIRAPAPMMRCSKIMHMMRDLHPTLLSALEGIVDQMVWFRECWHEEVLRQLRQGLTKCYQVAFDHRGDVNGAQITPRTLTFVKKLVSTFGIGFESGSSVYSSFSSSASESLARRAQATAQDPVFLKLKEQFVEDFDFSKPGSIKLHKLIVKLRKWIRILEAKTKLLPGNLWKNQKCLYNPEKVFQKLLIGSFLLEERCRFLSNFSQATAEVELPGEFLMPKTTIHNAFYVRIAKFMPKVELVHRHNFSARRLTIRGHNGKLYPYLVVNDAWLTESRREERVLQLLRMVNLFLEKRKATARRQLQFNVPRVVAVSPQMRLIEDNPSIISLTEIYRERCQRKKIDCEAAIAHYYDRLGSLQASGFSTNHQVLRDILKEVQLNLISDNMVKEWATYTYPNATDFWTFRKLFTQQVALAGFVEFTFHLTRLNPEMINVARDCGHVTFNFFKFDLDDSKGELDANRPVPFRLTPNMCELISPVGVSGIITHCMIAVARCLVQPQFSIASYFKAILKDEMLTWHKKKNDEALLTNSSVPSSEMDGELLITMVTNATNAIITRLQNLAQFENAESKVGTLISAAMNPDNLCRMDPAWNPWL